MTEGITFIFSVGRIYLTNLKTSTDFTKNQNAMHRVI